METGREGKPSGEWAFLVDSTEREILFIEAMLRTCDIPVMKRSRGTGESFGSVGALPNKIISLYVPADRLEEAKEAVTALETGPAGGPGETESGDGPS